MQGERSVQWQESYAAPGEVKCVALHTPENAALLRCGNRLYNSDFDTAAVIEEVAVESTGGLTEMCVRARCSAALLSQRVLMASEQVGNVEAAMYDIYRLNRRGLPIEAAGAQGFEAEAECELTWGTLLDAEELLAAAGGLGFRVVFDPATAAESFVVYRGARRLWGDAAYAGYFGDDVGNISEYRYAQSRDGLRNLAVVAGQEEDDGSREVVMAGNLAAAGEARRELYVDARSIRRKYQKARPTGQVDAHGNPVYSYTTASYSDAKYRAVLAGRGEEELRKTQGTLKVRCEVSGDSLRFGRDYALGDVMPVKLTAAGALLRARVVTVRRVYEPAGVKTLVTLGEFEAESRNEQEDGI